ncbi:unnamed protein product [Meganyctiphanes norvegica]|uniref:VWFA domain-containing protein n=1 Tax=Meganyctiphanes norvegica TaxID=48144 RepID=A0AAV2QWR0_MEGNR
MENGYSDDIKQVFRVRVNASSNSDVTVYVDYEEQLQRNRGMYTHNVLLTGQENAEVVELETRISEAEPLVLLKMEALPGKGNDTKGARVSRPYPEQATLRYRYTREDFMNDTDDIFSVSYDVKRLMDAGEMILSGDHFLHYFSPEGLPKMAVHTVFILDVSGSMQGNKIEQLKNAMARILKHMRPQDSFEILAFSDEVIPLGKYRVNEPGAVKRAVRKIRRLEAVGGTNIYDALQAGLATINGTVPHENVAKQVIFLTDGRGFREPRLILKAVQDANKHRVPIFSIAFGNNHDWRFIRQLSWAQRGFARRIPEDNLAEDELTDFYVDISTPLLTHMHTSYPESLVDVYSLVSDNSGAFYSGNEVVVCGKLLQGPRGRAAALGSGVIVDSTSEGGKKSLRFPRVSNADSVSRGTSDTRPLIENLPQRIYNYMRLQELLESMELLEDQQEQKRVRRQAAHLATQNGWVTPVTSMIVHPEGEKDYGPEEEIERDLRNFLDSSPRGRPMEEDLETDAVTERTLRGDRRPILSTSFRTSEGSTVLETKEESTNNLPFSFVDNDPHFVIAVPGLDLPVCFDVHGHEGDVYNLIRDSGSGILVNGQVTRAENRPGTTYFTRLHIALGPVNLTVTTSEITLYTAKQKSQSLRLRRQTPLKKLMYKASRKARSVWDTHEDDDDEYDYNDDYDYKYAEEYIPSSDIMTETISWNNNTEHKYKNIEVITSKRRQLDIYLGDCEAHFVVRRSMNKMGQSFLGFYVQQQNVFSDKTKGILGQFTSKMVGTLTPLASDLHRRDNAELAVFGIRKNSKKRYQVSQVTAWVASRRAFQHRNYVDCLFVRNQGRGLLDGRLRDYLRPCLHC